MVMEDLRFTKDHEWISVENNIATVGVSDYAQQQLGDVTFVELLEVSTEIEQAGMLGTVESVKAASEFFAPVSGSVVEVNTELEAHPELVNQEPYGRGWLCKLKFTKSEEVSNLMTADAYQQYVGGLE